MSVCPSFRSVRPCFWVTLSPQLDRYCRGKAEVRIINFKTTWSEFQRASQIAVRRAKPSYVYTILKKHHLPKVGPKQLCASAHLGRTHAAGTS